MGLADGLAAADPENAAVGQSFDGVGFSVG